MPIPGVVQPNILEVEAGLRLRRFDGQFAFALPWYQDEETVYLVDGKRTPYTAEALERMYAYLDAHGELYFIEVLADGVYRPHRGRNLLAGGHAHCHWGPPVPGKRDRRGRSSPP